MSADDAYDFDPFVLREIVDRILAAKAKEDEKKAAIRAAYAEVKAAGYCKTSFGKLIGYLRLPEEKRAALDAEPNAPEFALLLRSWAARPTNAAARDLANREG